MSDRLLVDTAGAAECLTLSVPTVERLIRTGELASVKVRGSRRVRMIDLEAYVDRLGDNNAAAVEATALKHGGHVRGRRRS